MKVKIHKLFQYLLETTDAAPEAIVGFSLSESPVLGDYLADLDPQQSLDWNGRDFRGLPELRDHVLRQAGLTGVLTPEDVLITAGAAEANYLAIMQLVQPGDEIVIETPGWPQAEVLARAIGAKVVHVTRREADGWALPLDQLADAVTAKTRMIFITNPNNPTGDLLGQDALEELVRIADRVGAWLLVDEVYAGLEWDAARSPSIAGMYARGITTGSVSKALGLQGLRTGWLICPDRYRAAIDKVRIEGRANLDQMNVWVAAQDGLNWVSPRAGLIGLARLPDGIDSDAFAQKLLGDPYRTFLLPGSAYAQPAHIRLGVGGGASVNLHDGLQRVAQALKDWESV